MLRNHATKPPLLLWARSLALGLGSLVLIACSNGRGSVEQPETQPAGGVFTVGGTVTGLTGTGLVLQNNGGNDLAVPANGQITFSNAIAQGAAYDVTVLTQPSAQTCTVTNGVGTMGTGNVTNIAVACASGSETFAVGGAVSGLVGSGLVLQNNGGDDLPITADGTFVFPAGVATGATYSITVATQPANPTQACTVANGSGTMGVADVADVTVACATGVFPIIVTVSGLVGSGLTLQNNGDEPVAAANGTVTVADGAATGSPYSVTVASQPTDPVQTCTVTNATGTVGAEAVTDITVSCATNVFTVGGTVTGFSGTGLVLQVNAANDFAVNRNGAFAFSTALQSGSPYVVSIRTQPSSPTQTCTIANASGVIVSDNVRNVAVTCVTQEFTVGGSVSGLAGSGLVLRKNGQEDLPIASNGSFTFAEQQASGSAYDVVVSVQPSNPYQTCTVANGSGAVGGGNVRTVEVTCATNTYAISGTVTGLLGDRVGLQNNSDGIEIESDGGFTFPAGVASAGAYNVTVSRQPATPTQSCTVANGTGTISNADITNVAVSCVTSEFTVGGTVSGLAGTGLTLRNNGADDLGVASDGPFAFATPMASGGTYQVAVARQPTGPTQVCTVSNPTGTVGGGPVTTVAISCVTTEYTIGGQVSGLLGGGLQLRNNGGAPFAVAADGTFAFPDSLPGGSTYDVSVAQQPASPTQVCTVANGVGTVAEGNVTSIAITCVTSSFTIGGTISGLRGTGLELQLNGDEILTLSFTSSFTFSRPVLSGQSYDVTVARQPTPWPFVPAQTCSVSNGSGIVGGENVTQIVVNCD